MSTGRQVRHQIEIEITPEMAFEAVTQARELREWLCDQAWTEVWPGGRYETRWSRGYRGEGKYTVCEAPRRAAITWQGTGEPSQTTVEFLVEPADEAVRVTVVHGGFGPGAEWDAAVAQSEKGWKVALENLKSVLETGIDLRIVNRPFLGIYLDGVTPERAAKEGLSVDHGIYVNDTIEGSAARTAGLQKGDVLVGLAGHPTPGPGELGLAIGGCKTGDEVDLDVVRGTARLVFKATLGQRPQPELPPTAEALVQVVSDRYAATDAKLKAAVEGLSEQEAGQRPAEGEWSVKQVLAHLSLVERDSQFGLATVALDGWLDGGEGNVTAMDGRVAAALEATPSLQALVARFFTDEAETIALLRGLPDAALAHKARFRRIAQWATGLPDHTEEHLQQIANTVAAIRKA